MEAGNHLFSEGAGCGTLLAGLQWSRTALTSHFSMTENSTLPLQHTFQSGSVAFFCTALAVRFDFTVSGLFFFLGQECGQSGIQSTL